MGVSQAAWRPEDRVSSAAADVQGSKDTHGNQSEEGLQMRKTPLRTEPFREKAKHTRNVFLKCERSSFLSLLGFFHFLCFDAKC